MKKIGKSFISLLMSGILLFVSSTFVFAGGMLDNLVQNPGFENGLDCWETKISSLNDSIDTKFCLLNVNTYGYKSLKATASESVSVSQEILLPISGTYKLSLFGKYENGVKPSDGEISVEIESRGESFTYTHPGDEKPDFDFSLVFTVSKSTKVNIILNTKNTTGIFDNVSLLRIGHSPDGSMGENILKNGSFEEGLNYWTQVGTENALTTDSIALSGKNSLFMGYYENKLNELEVQQTVSISEQSSQLYDFSGYINMNYWEGSAIGVFIQAEDQSGDVIVVIPVLASVSPHHEKEWKKFNGIFEVPEGTVRLRIRLFAVLGRGSFYLDDLCLRKVL